MRERKPNLPYNYVYLIFDQYLPPFYIISSKERERTHLLVPCCISTSNCNASQAHKKYQ